MTQQEKSILIIICVGFAILIIADFLTSIMGFSRELKYLNCEITRTYGAERQHYKRKKRRLWLSLIPFVRYR